jgi:hypothetical protein
MMKRSLLGMVVAPGETHGRADGSTPLAPTGPIA